MTGKRAAARAATHARIIEVAEQHLATRGASGLSLRGIAQDVGIAPSAIYRYYNGIDELFTALIIRAYNAQTAAVKVLADAHPTPATWEETVAVTIDLALGLRKWAFSHPHQYALIYGTPVPGYHAPEDTIAPAAGVAQAFLRCATYLTDGMEHDAQTHIPPPMVAFLISVYGTISFELFGHLRGVVDDTEEFFVSSVTSALGLLRSFYPEK